MCQNLENLLSDISTLLAPVLIAAPNIAPSQSDQILSPSGVSADSRFVSFEDVFVAVTGEKLDGHTFLDEAWRKGVRFFVVESCELAEQFLLSKGPTAIIVWQVSDSRLALSQLAAHFFNQRLAGMRLVGVTGTNGKSTTAWIVSQLIGPSFSLSASLGTLGLKVMKQGRISEDFELSELKRSGLTTPAVQELYQTLEFFNSLGQGEKLLAMEVSSHALCQKRVQSLPIEVGVFTNLTQDHLDYHGSMVDYAASKLKLFSEVDSLRTAVLNTDDPIGVSFKAELMRIRPDVSVICYGRDSSELQLKSVEQRQTSQVIEFNYKGEGYSVQLPLAGNYNAYNLLAAFGAGLALGLELSDLVSRVDKIESVPGRLECISNLGVDVFVDYAHTPDALSRVLSSLRELTQGELWVIFGCGGDRDRSKRPLMAEVARELADRVIFTNDNPRTESPEQIFQDMCSSGVTPDQVIADRRTAIHGVLEMAKSGDSVLVAGKGHEDYQILGSERVYFSDLEEVKSFFMGFDVADCSN